MSNLFHICQSEECEGGSCETGYYCAVNERDGFCVKCPPCTARDCTINCPEKVPGLDQDSSQRDDSKENCKWACV